MERSTLSAASARDEAAAARGTVECEADDDSRPAVSHDVRHRAAEQAGGVLRPAVLRGLRPPLRGVPAAARPRAGLLQRAPRPVGGVPVRGRQRVPAQPRADDQRAGQRHGRDPRLLRRGQPRGAGPAAPHRAAQRRAPVVRGAGDPGHGGPRPRARPRAARQAARAGRRRLRPGRRAAAGVRRVDAADGRAGLRQPVLAGAPDALDGAHGGPVRDPRGRRPLQRRGRGAHRRGHAPAPRGGRRRCSGGHPGCDLPDPARPREGRDRGGGGGRAGPPGAVRVHRRSRRAAHQLRRGAGQVPRPAGLPARQPGAGEELRRGDPALRRPGEEPVPADHRRADHRRGHHSGGLPGHGADGFGQPRRARLPRARHLRPLPDLHRREQDPHLR